MTHDEAVNAALLALAEAMTEGWPDTDPAAVARSIEESFKGEPDEPPVDLVGRVVLVPASVLYRLLKEARFVKPMQRHMEFLAEELDISRTIIADATEAFNDKRLKTRDQQNAAVAKVLGLKRRHDPVELYLNFYRYLIREPSLFKEPIDPLDLLEGQSAARFGNKRSKDEALELTAVEFGKSVDAMYQALKRANKARETPIPNLLPGNPANRTGTK